MRLSDQTFFKRSFSAQRVLIATIFGCIAALTGPFGTFDTLSLISRIALWLPIALLTLVAIGLGSVCIRTFAPAKTLIWHWIGVSAVVALVYPPVLYGLSKFHVFGSQAPVLPYFYILFVTICFAGFIVVSLVLMRPEAMQSHLPRLYSRLPQIGKARITRITVDDHYTVVYLDDGTSARLLLRFADSVKEMDETAGFLTHRSHWVAAESVKSGVREGAKEFVVMNCGDKVPVSKTYRANVVRKGLLS